MPPIVAPEPAAFAPTAPAQEKSGVEDLIQLINAVRQPRTDAQWMQDALRLSDLLVRSATGRFAVPVPGFVGRGSPTARLAGALELSYQIQAGVARLKKDQKAQVAALHDLETDLKKAAAQVEARYKAGQATMAEVELARLHVERVVAARAHEQGKEQEEIAAWKRALAAADRLDKVDTAAWQRGAASGLSDPFGAAKYRCEAKLALADLTTAEPSQAAKAKASALEGQLAFAQGMLQQADKKYRVGLGSFDQFALARYYREQVAAALARERGNEDAGIAARERAVAAARQLLEAARRRLEDGRGAPEDALRAQSLLADAEVEMANVAAANPAAAFTARWAALEAHRKAAEAILKLLEARVGAGMTPSYDLLEAACRYVLVRLQMAEAGPPPAPAHTDQEPPQGQPSEPPPAPSPSPET